MLTAGSADRLHHDASSEALTFLFTDIVDSTQLWDRDPVSMSQALDCHDSILCMTVDRHFGFILTAVGDGFCMAFSDPSQAVRAGVEASEGLRRQDWNTPEPLLVRMAIHTGEAERKNETYVGPPLNLAARILSLAEPGEILVSHTTRDLTVATLDGGIRFSDLGECRLRGISAPERIYRIEPRLTET